MWARSSLSSVVASRRKVCPRRTGFLKLRKPTRAQKGIIAHAALERGESVRTDLAQLAANPLVKGIRRNLQGEADPQSFLRPEFVAGV